MKKVVPNGAFLLPDKARKVFDGQIFDVYQWPQEMFDGSGATFEMLKRPDTLQILAVHEGKFVVLVDEQPGMNPHQTIPGGRAEESDSSWQEGAQRELLEETGMTFKNWKLISVVQPTPKIEWFCPLFLATDLIEQVEPSFDAGEKITVGYMNFEELRDLAMSGHEPRLSYLSQVIARYPDMEALLNSAVFEGREIDR